MPIKNITEEVNKNKKAKDNLLIRTLIFMGVLALVTTVLTSILEFGFDFGDFLPFLEELIGTVA